MTPDKLKRINTHVLGLDDDLDGGIPKESVVLIAGPPGTMKSSLGFYILYKNALEEDKHGVYISLEETRESLIDNMSSLGMDWNDVDRKMSILDLGLIRSRMDEAEEMDWMGVFKRYVKNLRKNLDNEFLVIDSLSVLKTIAVFDNPRQELFKLFEWLRGLEVTSFVIHETSMEKLEFTESGEGFLSDGIIHLDLKRKDNSVDLFLSVLKMRKTSHSRDYYPLLYEDGFEIVKN